MILARGGHDVGEVDGGPPQIDLSLADARHIEEVVEKLAEMMGLPPDDLPDPDRSRFHGAGLIQHLDPVEDHAERVAQLVREHVQELILRAVGRFRFRAGGLLLREQGLPGRLALLLGQVGHHQADMRWRPSEPARGDIGRHRGSIGGPQHGLERSRPRREQLLESRLVRAREEVGHRESDDLVESHPDHVLETAIAVEDVARGGEHERALLHLLDDRPVRLVGIDDGVDLGARGSLDDIASTSPRTLSSAS